MALVSVPQSNATVLLDSKTCGKTGAQIKSKSRAPLI